jgi:hypothetical protein
MRSGTRSAAHAHGRLPPEALRLDIRFRGQFCYIDVYTEPERPDPDWPPPDWPESKAARRG